MAVLFCWENRLNHDQNAQTRHHHQSTIITITLATLTSTTPLTPSKIRQNSQAGGSYFLGEPKAGHRAFWRWIEENPLESCCLSKGKLHPCIFIISPATAHLPKPTSHMPLMLSTPFITCPLILRKYDMTNHNPQLKRQVLLFEPSASKPAEWNEHTLFWINHVMHSFLS